jgi:hypothetical protein
MAHAYCDTDLHGGVVTDALFTVTAGVTDKFAANHVLVHRVGGYGSMFYATCADHLPVAVSHVMSKGATKAIVQLIGVLPS